MPRRLAKAVRPAFLALDQPFLWVETTGTTTAIAAIFMPSPPSICLQIEVVKTLCAGGRGVQGGCAPLGNVW